MLSVTSVTVTHLYVNTTIASLSGNMQKGLVHVKTRFEMEDNWAVKMRHRFKKRVDLYNDYCSFTTLAYNGL